MQTIKSLSILTLSCALLSSGIVTMRAQSITNADSTSTLDLGASWVGGVPAGPANVAVWDSTVQANTTKTLGANLAWGGIQVFNPIAAISIAADGNTLTNGASGIDMSLATVGLTVGCPLVLSADQSWYVTNGLVLNINGQLLASTATTLTLNGPGTIDFSGTVNGTYTGNISLNGGTLIVAGANANNNSAIGTGVITNNSGTLESAGKIVGDVLQFNGNCVVDANLGSFTLDGAWEGSGTVIVTNMISGSTVTAGGNGNGGGTMANFTGTVIISSSNSDGSTTAGNFRFNNGGANNNLGNAAMTLDLGNGNAHFVEKNSSQTTTFGALYGGPNTQLAQPEKYVIGALNVPDDTFSGTVTGAASTFTKNGTGAFIWNNTNPNTYTGATTINGGILQIGDGATLAAGALGSGPVVINTSGLLVFNKPDAFSITNAISGAGALIQTNSSTLTFYGTNSGSGTTLVGGGTFALGAPALISGPIFLGGGTVFDVSQDPTFALNQTLAGSGTVNGALTAIGGTINPGGSGTAGTLSFASGLTESGGVNNQIEISGSSNDLISVTGDLTVSGVNNITLSGFGGGTIPTGVYPVIQYTGTLTGGPANFSVTAIGISGVVTNITTTTPPEIAVIVTPPLREPTNLFWKGDGTLNNWDTSSSNWVNGVTSFAFEAGDSVTFDDSGAPNTTVNLALSALPAAVTFNNTVSYTVTGTGGISGSAGITKTNTGSVTILTTNSYTGPTVVGQGTLEVQDLAISGAPSAIGAASGNPTNLILSGAVFKYSGASTVTDRGMTLNGAGGTFDVVNGTTLTLNGLITGAGSFGLTDAGTLTLGNPNTYTGGTVISNGVLALGSNNANNNGAGAGGLGPTNSPVTFYGGALQLYGAGASQGANYNTVYNPLVVPAGQSGTLVMFPRGPVNTGAGAGLFSSLSGGGTLNLEVNYVRDALSGDWSAFSGQIIVTNFNSVGDEFRINNNFGYANAAIYLNGPVTMDSALAAHATINIGELGGISTSVIGPGNSSQPGPTWVVGWKNTTNTFAGTLMDDNSGSSGGQTSIIKVGTGAWYLAGQNIFTGSTIISNGILGLTNVGNGDPSLSSSTNIFINAGATLDVSGRSDDLFQPNASGVLAGGGTIDGILDTSAGGTIAPGGGMAGGIGTLTVTNDINLGGVVWMKLDRSAIPSNDRLASASFINYNGTLVVTNIGPRLQAGDTFKLFDSGTATYNNSFTSIVLPSYYTWNTNNLPVNGTITVTAAAASPTLTADFSGFSSGTIALSAANGLPGGPVTVLSSTNLALPAADWTQVTTGNFDISGNFTTSVTVDPTGPTQFFILSAQ